MKKKKIGIIGCGTIGSALAKALSRKFRAQAELAYLCDHHRDRALALQKQLKTRARITGLAEVLRRSDLVIEAASVSVVRQLAPKLRPGSEILIMSVGGLLDEAVRRSVKQKKVRLWVPSGAIAGVDGLLAAAQAGLQSVRLVTRKPPAGLSQAPYFKTRKFPALRGRQEVLVFKGSAREAIRAFPQNINVAAILSLAGLGDRRTRVEIWTSKAYRVNQHEVTVRGAAGEIRTVTRNVPSRENPKTSALAVYSALAELERIFSPVRIGT